MLCCMKQVFLSAALCALAGTALGEVPSDLVTATVLPGWQMEGGNHMAALELVLAPGWKTYWRAPGDAGIPPVFDWAGSRNIADVRLHWPRPDVFETSGMQTIGYHDRLVLPFEVFATTAGEPVHVALQVDLGVCSDICVPASITVSADLQGVLPPGGARHAAIKQALADQPGHAGSAGMTSLACDVTPIDDGLRVTARLTMPPIGAVETVVLESQQSGVWVSEALTVRRGDQLVATVDMVNGQNGPFLFERDRVRVTVLAGPTAVEVQGCPAG